MRYVLFCLLIAFFLCPKIHAQLSPDASGYYEWFKTVKESEPFDGDTYGIQVRIVRNSTGYSAAILLTEGTTNGVLIDNNVSLKGDQIRIRAKGGSYRTVQISGTINDYCIRGDIESIYDTETTKHSVLLMKKVDNVEDPWYLTNMNPEDIEGAYSDVKYNTSGQVHGVRIYITTYRVTEQQAFLQISDGMWGPLMDASEFRKNGNHIHFMFRDEKTSSSGSFDGDVHITHMKGTLNFKGKRRETCLTRVSFQ